MLALRMGMRQVVRITLAAEIVYNWENNTYMRNKFVSKQ